MRDLAFAVTPANSTTFWNTIDLFYTASATAKNISYDSAGGETSHRERSGLTTTCGCLFGFVCKKKAHVAEEI